MSVSAAGASSRRSISPSRRTAGAQPASTARWIQARPSAFGVLAPGSQPQPPSRVAMRPSLSAIPRQ